MSLLKKIKTILGPFYHPLVLKFRMKTRNPFEKSFAESDRKTRIYVDLTHVFKSDRLTGIERVTRKVSEELKNLKGEIEVVTVFFNSQKIFSFCECESGKPIDLKSGDVFFEIELATDFFPQFEKHFLEIAKKGVKVSFFLHDLLPVRYPQFFLTKARKDFVKWLNSAVKFNQVIANSDTTLQDLKAYLSENSRVYRNPELKLSYSLLGCDFSDLKSEALPAESSAKDRISFLMVSTVEPRKNYGQVVKAFDELWKRNLNVELKIVGRKGWNAQEIFDLIERNPEFEKRLCWYNSGISDDELVRLYAQSDALIMASHNEGFGLAVAEGAYFKKALILRDIPVFREIAGENAWYFDGFEPLQLADSLTEWIELFRKNEHPDSSKIELPAWKDCASKIYDSLRGI